MNIRFEDKQLRDTLATLELLDKWEHAKQLFLDFEYLYLTRLFRGPKPREIIHVFDSTYALRDVGPIVLVAPLGLTDSDRGIIWLMPETTLGTIVHEYLHYLFDKEIRHKIPEIAVIIAKAIEDKYSIEIHPSDVETSLSANYINLDELIIHVLTRMVTCRAIYETTQAHTYAALLANNIRSDLGIRTGIRDLANLIQATVTRYVASKFRKTALEMIDMKLLETSWRVETLYSTLRNIYFDALANSKNRLIENLNKLIIYTATFLGALKREKKY